MAASNTQRVAVIGAGLGGLSAAISLALDGHSVDVFERHDKSGGKLNVLEKDGFTFDLGPSILTMPHVFRTLFDRAGKQMEDYVTIQEVVPHWRNFFEDGFVMDLTPDLAQMEKELAKLPNGQQSGFYEFLEYSRKLCKLTEEGYFAQGLDSFQELVTHYGPVASLFGFDALRTMDQGVRRFIKNPRLIDILNYFIKYVGSSPYDAPALMNLLPFIQFGYGLWYVQGGMYKLAVGLERLARELGVRFHFASEIRGLRHNQDRIHGLSLADGAQFDADLVVSNMEVIPAHRELLGETKEDLRRFRRFAPSCSGLVLHLGVDRLYPQLAHHNFLYARDSHAHFKAVFKDNALSQDPTIYLVAPCKTDPGQAPEGCEVIKVLPHIPHIHADHPHTETDYAAFRERVLDKLERMGLENLRRHIVCEDRWTPVDIQSRYLSTAGSIYGTLSDRNRNLGFRAPQRSDRFRNLYFVGGSVNPGGGMPMVTLSGQLVRDKIQADLQSGRL